MLLVSYVSLGESLHFQNGSYKYTSIDVGIKNVRSINAVNHDAGVFLHIRSMMYGSKDSGQNKTTWLRKHG